MFKLSFKGSKVNKYISLQTFQLFEVLYRYKFELRYNLVPSRHGRDCWISEWNETIQYEAVW